MDWKPNDKVFVPSSKFEALTSHPTAFYEALDAATTVRAAPRKTFISLCCKTGFKAFGGTYSEATICEYFIAPFHSVHGVVASQFCQSFLAYHLLDGETVGVAFRHAREATPGGGKF